MSILQRAKGKNGLSLSPKSLNFPKPSMFGDEEHFKITYSTKLSGILPDFQLGQLFVTTIQEINSIDKQEGSILLDICFTNTSSLLLPAVVAETTVLQGLTLSCVGFKIFSFRTSDLFLHRYGCGYVQLYASVGWPCAELGTQSSKPDLWDVLQSCNTECSTGCWRMDS